MIVDEAECFSRIVEFRIPGYPGPSKEQGTEVRLMRVKSFAAKYECSCSFMLFTNTIFKTISVKEMEPNFVRMKNNLQVKGISVANKRREELLDLISPGFL